MQHANYKANKKGRGKEQHHFKKGIQELLGRVQGKTNRIRKQSSDKVNSFAVSRAQMEVEKAVAAAATDKNIRRFLVRPCRDWMTGADVVAMMNRIEVMAAAAMGKKSSK